jgi:hypothetical protein
VDAVAVPSNLMATGRLFGAFTVPRFT